MTVIWASKVKQLDPVEIGQLFQQGFRGKFRSFGFSAATTQLGCQLLGEYLQQFYRQDLVVSIQGGHLNGCLLLNHGQKALGQRTFLRRLGQTLPWRDRLRLLLFLGLLDQPVPQGTTYVDFVAVTQSQRRQGIGTALLKFCQQHFSRLTLSVVTGNHAAYRLYRQLGFCEKQTQHSQLTQLCFGFREWSEMQWTRLR
ncbi:GNAT family N-acetyltransferase [Levilactobacillus enshiensis]|uniref:GNAT family N-acetyltransferase n=1 Tax=Levilactobacillus enshiensis TaxID=2590213 RepID=UPI00117A4659|nr:GNAT family N-acetyltransferase [Levilactobacillus enshiensis]